MKNAQVNPVGELVKSTRKEHGWSQEEFAAISDVAVRTIQRIESGEKANIETLRAIATAFKIDVSLLLPLNEPVPEEDVARMGVELRKQAAEIEKEVNVLPQIQNGKELMSVVASFSMVNTDYPQPTDTEEGNAITGLLSTVRDYGDLQGHLDPHGDIETVMDADRQLAVLSRHGLVVFAGKLRGSVVFPSPTPGEAPTRLRYGAVFIRRLSEVKTFADPNAGGRTSARFRVPFGPVNLA